MKLLEGKWAFVTGSSRGIGQHIALGLARRKCNVIVHGRTEANAKGTAEKVKAAGVDTRIVFGDLGKPQEVDAIIRQIRDASVPVDILYNNAAIMAEWKPIWNFSQDEWMRIFQVNLWAMIALCNAFAPGMKTRGYGRIINLTSGIRETPNLAPYSVSKAAVDKYTADLATELRGTNVLVNAVDPGWLKTDMGGANAEHEVDTVLPGALVPALLDSDGPSGRMFAAQDYSMLAE